MTSYAKLHRIAIRVALCLASVGGFQVANATYANLTPPPGWVQGGNAMATYAPPSAAAWVSSRAAADAAIASASATSRIRVALPLAQPAAARVAAAVLFSNPAIRTAVGIATWLGVAGMVWDVASSTWRQLQPQQQPGYWGHPGLVGRRYSSPGEVCVALHGKGQTAQAIDQDSAQCVSQTGVFGDVVYRYTESGQGTCPAGWTPSSAGCMSPAVQQPSFVEKLNPSTQTMPSTVPSELPNGTPLPVAPPVINPDSTGRPQPLFLPTGNPVRNPSYDSSKPVTDSNQPYLQPGIRVVPAPTADNPWQVDIQPINRPVATAEPNPNPITDQPTDNDKPREDDRDLCQRNPDILACAKPELDAPDGEIPKTTKDVSYQPERLFGGGSCPANKVMSIHGQQITVWNWDQSCSWITGAMRPIVLVLCGFAAFVIVSAGAKS